MKLGSILAKVGSTVFKSIVPGGGLIIDLVNGFLPEEKKLPNEATGEQITQAVNNLPPDQQAQLLSKEYDVEIAEINSWTQIQGSLAEADKAGASTRPKIAMIMAYVVSFVVVSFSTMLIIAVAKSSDPLTNLTNTWPLALAIIGTPVALLRAYFGMRSKEKKSRYSAVVGQPVQSGLIAEFVKMIKK